MGGDAFMEEKSMRDMYKLGLGEEVANCVTHGIMALLCLIALPAQLYTHMNLVEPCVRQVFPFS